MRKYFPYALILLCIGVTYLYFAKAKDVKRLTDHRTIVTNHWTGEVKHCIITPGQSWVCQAAESIPVPWYMAIVQHTVESFN